MHLRRMPIRLASGKTKLSPVWYVEWRDHRGSVHRWAAFKDRTASEEYGHKLELLVARHVSGAAVGDLAGWFAGLARRRRDQLAKLGLLEGRTAQVTGLDVSVQHYRDWLVAREYHPTHISNTTARIRAVLKALAVSYVSQLEARKLEAWLKAQRDDGMSIATSNHYLKALKSFCNWLVDNELAETNPLARVRKLNEAADRRHDRRALSPDELAALLTAARGAPARFGMTGEERYWAYRLASEMGLLAGEMRKLTVADFDLTGCEPTVTIPAAYARKRRETYVLPLRVDTARGLRAFCGHNKSPGIRVFALPVKTAEMLRADLADARISYRDDAGRCVDFYALRHTAITNLGYTARSFADLQALARHRTPAMTARYAHARLVDMRAAVEGLSKPVTKKRRRASS